MDVFEFRSRLISEYEHFSRSFSRIRAADINQYVDKEYEQGRFWPAPLIQLNPNFVPGGSIDELVENNVLDPECAKIFRIKSQDNPFGSPMILHRHQVDAIHVAKKQESYVLTTGTGSGKSLAYFIPIVDDVLRRKRSGQNHDGISAIVVYPMNALCNSQLEELEKFLRLGYGRGKEPVTFARYTGQEGQDERERIAKNPPDILLTNYVMLELLLTRFTETDKAVRQHADGLRFLVLDELHTYRGRQGADVAMLVRRVREAFNRDLLCIGTSATMASDGSASERNQAVAKIATRLFGARVKPENVITETLAPVVDPSTPMDRENLYRAIRSGLPTNPSYHDLRTHPIAAWVERNLGVEEQDGKLVRISRPKTIDEAGQELADDSGLSVEDCRDYLENFLLMAYGVRNEKGQSFCAFRLHQFISGAGNVYATLEPEGDRYITLDGQKYMPGDREKILFNLAFCRECGQEFFPVWSRMSGHQPEVVLPRELNERGTEDEDVVYGYVMPDPEGVFDRDNLEEKYPDDWIEYSFGQPQLKSYYRQFQPVMFMVNTLGQRDSHGMKTWFVPGNFRFCPQCGVTYDGSIRSELSKLSSLSSEGRSSATTVLTLSALRYLIGTDQDDKAKKILGFTDNRQDASLQAGHFNDFIQILLLRGALLAAMRNEADQALSDELLTQCVVGQLNLELADFAENLNAKGGALQNTLRAMRDVIGYRLYFDLRRGWRITSPNLEQLGLLRVDYEGLVECCEDEDEWRRVNPLLASATPEVRFQIAKELLDTMRRGLCIKTIYLDPHFQEQLRNRSFALLKEPWGLSEDEHLTPNSYMIPRSRSGRGRMDVNPLFVSHRSRFGRRFKSRQLWGLDNPDYPKRFDEEFYETVIDDLLKVLSVYGLVDSEELSGGLIGYRIDASLLRWTTGDGEYSSLDDSVNVFFQSLYENVAGMLQHSDRFLHQLEAREHTAQVESDDREIREARFRKGFGSERVVDGKVEPAGLPVMFCSPTMELGVDISTLNTVYMRNVPPTPANYAQRSGRAGRSGQPALVITYCAARSPHDQYFFADPTRMVAGSVNPPSIDLANKDLIETHLHAVWLVETGCQLPGAVKDVLEHDQGDALPIRPDLIEQMGLPKVTERATLRAKSILDMLRDELTSAVAPWLTDSWLENVIGAGIRRFDQAFDRWRTLFKATTIQMKMADTVARNAASTEKERSEAKARYDAAFRQRSVLLADRASVNSDFNTYRYLASEGFLPGYNFPRLPLMAYIPGRRKRIGRDGFLSRPRFIGLSEFGPQAIIYHEGSTYRVRRVILTVSDEQTVSVTATLPVQRVCLCPECGYGHFGDQVEFELCINCDEPLSRGRRIINLYRIDQVSTVRVTRITSDEEERQRQGYEMVTTIRYAEDQGHLRRETFSFSDENEELMTLDYGPASTIWRINLGWRRRKEKSIYGFPLDVNTGDWSKDEQAPPDAQDERVREGKSVHRVTPYVEDTKNVLVIQPKINLSETALVTFQYALKRGIEAEFQLEEAELAVEPLPDRENRKAILLYEASEGGAGVLTRVATEPGALARVARKALEICHYETGKGGWTHIGDLKNTSLNCEAGCYRCLLSYYNQVDHGEIDRKNEESLDLLCRLTKATGEKVDRPTDPGDSYDELVRTVTSSLEKEWLDFLKTRGYNLPDRAQPYLEEYNTRPDFAYVDKQVVIYIDGPHHDTEYQQNLDREITATLEDAGLTVIRFDTDKTLWDSVVQEYFWVFGYPSTSPDVM